MEASEYNEGAVGPEADAAVLEAAVLEAPANPDSARPASVAEGKDPEFQQLAASFVVFERRTGYVVLSVVWLIVVAATAPLLFTLERGWVAVVVLVGWIVLASLMAWFAHEWPAIKFRNSSWCLSPMGLEIRRGVWWQHRISIPVARVQHVDVSQGPVQRMFDLGKLTIHTAGTQNSSVELDGLEHSRALALRDQLIAQKESLDVT